MSEILRKIRVPLESGEVRELEMPPIPEIPKIPGLLDHLGELKFVQCSLQEYNSMWEWTRDAKTVYFVHTPSRLLKIMLGNQLIWFCEPEEIEYIPIEGFSSRSNILGFKSGDINPAGIPLGFPNRISIKGRSLDRIVLWPMDYLRVSCSAPASELSMSSDAPVVDLSALDTSEITDMTSMCNFSQVTELDVSGFDTRNVTSMESMFSGCRQLKKLDLGGFNTANVKKFRSMFENCTSLTSLNVLRWDLNHCNYVDRMFANCTSLESLDLSYWSNAIRFKTLQSMFENCTSLKSLNLSSFNTSGAYREDPYIKTFYNCSSLETLDISNFDFMLNQVQPIDMFFGCSSLKNLKFGKNYHKGHLWLDYCPLTHKSAMSVLNSLRETEKATNLVFSHETYDTLTEEELALAVSLGFYVFAW